MDPNAQQPAAAAPPTPPPAGPNPVAAPATPTPQFADSPVAAEQPVPQQFTQPNPQQYTQSNMNYGAGNPQQDFDPNYLDTIAPSAKPPTFFSGSFGKIFFALIGVFVLAVSIIVAMQGGEETADLQQVVVRLDNYNKVTKEYGLKIKSNSLKTNNSRYSIWALNALRDGEDLLKQAEVKKTQYDKKMVALESTGSADLGQKLEDAYLNAIMDRVYAGTMANETQKMIILYDNMSRKSKAQKIREYAAKAVNDLKPIQKAFEDFVDT